ncbi:hypothetical protein HPB48_000394 [Haemaphysalis longicornis]|uniref:Carboxylic ester hydrolase n=1 Tax=Haemaphysalis longicornis TaxID=44386 RepID=A0A9J6FYX5_HAELO|nr:hypothetical protein HPB48_000394 [Haemaphysalis longicornis]
MVRNKWLHFHFIIVTSLNLNAILQPLMAASVHENVSLFVETKQGLVKGFKGTSRVGKTVRIFYGIPYAEPPVGNLRFQRPVEKEPWTGVLEATTKPNSCVQTVIEPYGPNTNLSEDCLKLNVWAPEQSHKQDKFAVLVWIHGGGFCSGSSTLDIYDASTLVSEEMVIVVSFNYRVASLGFLSFGNELVPGNAGLHDQRLAMKWVKNNIGAFGGDENRITIFGESSGAVSIGFHLLSHFSRTLFKRAILQSGSAFAPWGFRDNATARGLAEALAVALNCSDALDNTTLQCLLNKDAEEILKNEKRPSGIVEFMFLPVQGDDSITNFTQVLSGSGTFSNDKAVLLGSNANEGSFFLEKFLGHPAMTEPNEVTEENFMAVIKALNPGAGEPPVDKILDVYGGVIPSSTEEKLSVLDAIVSDYHFTCPVVQFSDLLGKGDASVYQYLFAHRSSRNRLPEWTGVTHGEEIAFEFGEPLNETQEWDEVERILSANFMRYWANFAKTGYVFYKSLGLHDVFAMRA